MKNIKFYIRKPFIGKKWNYFLDISGALNIIKHMTKVSRSKKRSWHLFLLLRCNIHM